MVMVYPMIWTTAPTCPTPIKPTMMVTAKEMPAMMMTIMMVRQT